MKATLYTIIQIDGQLHAVPDDAVNGAQVVSNPGLTLTRALNLIARLEEGSLL